MLKLTEDCKEIVDNSLNGPIGYYDLNKKRGEDNMMVYDIVQKKPQYKSIEKKVPIITLSTNNELGRQIKFSDSMAILVTKKESVCTYETHRLIVNSTQ